MEILVTDYTEHNDDVEDDDKSGDGGVSSNPGPGNPPPLWLWLQRPHLKWCQHFIIQFESIVAFNWNVTELENKGWWQTDCELRRGHVKKLAW